MQFTVEQWFSDNSGGAWSGLSQEQAWDQFNDLTQELALDERVLLFRVPRLNARGERSRELIAQAWVDHLSETQVRVAAGFSNEGQRPDRSESDFFGWVDIGGTTR